MANPLRAGRARSRAKVGAFTGGSRLRSPGLRRSSLSASDAAPTGSCPNCLRGTNRGGASVLSTDQRCRTAHPSSLGAVSSLSSGVRLVRSRLLEALHSCRDGRGRWYAGTQEHIVGLLCLKLQGTPVGCRGGLFPEAGSRRSRGRDSQHQSLRSRGHCSGCHCHQIPHCQGRQALAAMAE